MSDELEITLPQAMRAQKAMRDELGLPEEKFPVSAFVGMISDEIEQLRETGRSDSQICDLVAASSGIAIDAADLQRFYALPEERQRRD